MDTFSGKSKARNDETDEIFDEIEFEELEEELSGYIVKFPDESEINATVDTLRQYVPKPKTESAGVRERFAALLKRAGTEMTVVSKSYWIASAVLFIFGWFIAYQPANDPVLTLVFFAPLPLIFGLVEVFKGRDHGMLEMEQSCKFSAYEIILSRLFLIGVYNVTLITALTLTIQPAAGVPLGNMMLMWFTPFTFFAAVALWLSMSFKGHVFVTTFLAFWFGLMGLVLINAQWIEMYMNAHPVLHVIFAGVGVMLTGIQLSQLIKKYAVFEGGPQFEVNY